MSNRYLDMVWDLRREVKGAPLIVLLALAEYADRDTGQCWPSISALAEMTRMAERNVQVHLAKLRDAGIITIELNKAPHNAQSNLYTLTWPTDEHGESLPLPPPKEARRGRKKKKKDSSPGGDEIVTPDEIVAEGGDEIVTPDEMITPDEIVTGGVIISSGGGRSFHQGGGDEIITQTLIEPWREPSTEPPPSASDDSESSDPDDSPGGGGGGGIAISISEEPTPEAPAPDTSTENAAQTGPARPVAARGGDREADATRSGRTPHNGPQPHSPPTDRQSPKTGRSAAAETPDAAELRRYLVMGLGIRSTDAIHGILDKFVGRVPTARIIAVCESHRTPNAGGGVFVKFLREEPLDTFLAESRQPVNRGKPSPRLIQEADIPERDRGKWMERYLLASDDEKKHEILDRLRAELQNRSAV